ncbi:phospholipase D family protein [Sphingomonas aracearum]|uniref:Phospholipase D n=1 Tax=Sphingomonas aracearum TaxID=2283317 RepID=A0A369VYI4_9SPHN|nr:phospholipase D family protein [Sphingomonas aracearum]RDE06685.1 phospholipase D family protein [Sphingomonas aracearum]
MDARKLLPSSPAGRWAAGIGASVAALALLRWASRLPEPEPGTPAPAFDDPGATALGKGIAPHLAEHPDLSGLHLLSDPLDAFAARMLLVRRAERSLDLQYYIWHGDRTGTLLLEAIHQAAGRGVQVRLLLDDNGIAGLDPVLAGLDEHPNIEVRLFNPFRIRFPKSIGYVADFQRLNRRMHNKSFVADGAVTIVGGRNIGDEYFGAGDAGLFADLDVMAVGPVVRDVSAGFDVYWRSASACRASRLLPKLTRRERQRRRLAHRASVVERDASARRYVERVKELPLVEQLVAGTLSLEWAKVRMLSDDPAKAQGLAEPSGLLAGKLEQAIGTPQREIGVIAGYFVPGDRGTQMLSDLARRGVAVSVLTNAYATNDVAVVHAGYAPYRPALLAAGVRLFELCAEASGPSARERRRGSRLGVGSKLRGSGTGSVAALRSGASTLHAKTFTVDRERLFIGSFNFDPRSIDLNTELGFLIESPTLASGVADAFDTVIPEHSYRVARDADGTLCWHAPGGKAQVREPGMSPLDHLLVRVAAALPIQWLL